MSQTPELRIQDIEAARERLGDRVYRTPFANAWNLSQLTGSRISLKLENLQITGSFKERGALNRLLLLDAAERASGVIAASAGNHAQGVALHATRLGIPACIVMPERTPLVKVERTRRYGGEVVLHGATFDEAFQHARALCEERGAYFIHPFDDIAVMAGQGTIGLEILEQNPRIQNLIVPIGGGGLIAGIACAIKEVNPRIRIIGVEAEACASMQASVRAGRPVAVESSRTIADGIAVKNVGEKTLSCVQHWVDDIVSVSEEDIARAIILLLEEEKVAAEGAAAASLAALLDDQLPDLRDQRTGLIICGGNIDINVMSQIIERGLVRSGRIVRLEINIPDVPGALARLTQIVGRSGANVLEIHHDRQFKARVGDTDVVLTLETRGFEHIERLCGTLRDEGYEIDVPG